MLNGPYYSNIHNWVNSCILFLREKCFFENYKKYAGDFIFLSEDAKLRELLNVMSKCKKEDKANATEAICNYIRSIYFVIDKEVNVWFGADANVTNKPFVNIESWIRT